MKTNLTASVLTLGTANVYQFGVLTVRSLTAAYLTALIAGTAPRLVTGNVILAEIAARAGIN